jgi:hypothetical protein
MAMAQTGPKPEPLNYDPQPWDRLPEEPATAFLAFAAFRDLGPGRTIRKAWAVYSGQSEGVNGTWFNYSKAFKWVSRCEAFDAFTNQLRRDAVRALSETESARITENQRVHRDNEQYLSQQAFEKAAEILSIPVARSSFIEQRDGKTIIHKATLLSPSHLFAAAALMKAGSDIGRRGLGIKEDDAEAITPEGFKKLFYKTTGEIAKDFPSGALPAPVDNPATKPAIHLPGENDKGTNGHANGNGHSPPQSTAIVTFKPTRARP